MIGEELGRVPRIGVLYSSGREKSASGQCTTRTASHLPYEYVGYSNAQPRLPRSYLYEPSETAMTLSMCHRH